MLTCSVAEKIKFRRNTLVKSIYIILTQSGTIISKTIKLFTHDRYNHASICLDDSFQSFYSFGRLQINNVFSGGFVKENAFTHVLGKYKNVPCLILKKEVSEKQYEKIQDTIQIFTTDPQKFKYDYFNLFFAKTPITFSHKNRFFCSEFVAYVLSEAGITPPNRLEKIRPFEFTSLENVEVLYQGELKKWCETQGRPSKVSNR